jgi:hypothetical protein
MLTRSASEARSSLAFVNPNLHRKQGPAAA